MAAQKHAVELEHQSFAANNAIFNVVRALSRSFDQDRLPRNAMRFGT